MKERTILLCCGTNRGCPELTINEDDSVHIKDDYGNTVTMKLSQARIIGDKIDELLESEPNDKE
jgi:hypothetical protein